MHELQHWLLPTGYREKYMHFMRAWQVSDGGRSNVLHELRARVYFQRYSCNDCKRLRGVQGRQLLARSRNYLQHMHRGQVHERVRREHVHAVRRRAGVRPEHRHDDVLPVHREAADLRHKQNLLLRVQRR